MAKVFSVHFINIRCCPDTVEGHFKCGLHKDAYEANQRRQNSHFDREKEKKSNNVEKQSLFWSVQALNWLVKEETASTKITSLIELIEKMGVADLKYFQKRSGPVLCKVLLLIAKQKFKTL